MPALTPLVVGLLSLSLALVMLLATCAVLGWVLRRLIRLLIEGCERDNARDL